MLNINEMETLEMSDEDIEYYREELEEIRRKETGIILAWVVPDEDDGHIEYKVLNNWTDAGIWERQL